MKALKKCGIIVMLLVSGGCSSHSAYTALQERNKVECQNLPSAEYERCMSKTEKTYEEYESQRKALKKDSATK